MLTIIIAYFFNFVLATHGSDQFFLWLTAQKSVLHGLEAKSVMPGIELASLHARQVPALCSRSLTCIFYIK